MTDAAEVFQQTDVGKIVELFSCDVTSLGGGVLYWTPSRPQSGTPIVYGGNTYTSVDIKAEGFDKSTKGTLPRPRLSMSNADNIAGALLTQYSDLRGCPVTRIKVPYDYLDDPDAEWPTEIFRVERKVSQNKNLIVLELAASSEQAGAQIPGRPMLRDVCLWTYRRWNGAAFDYTNATCPYTGAACFTKLGAATTSANDACGKKIRDCKRRFGAAAELPFGGFPGMARVRT